MTSRRRLTTAATTTAVSSSSNSIRSKMPSDAINMHHSLLQCYSTFMYQVASCLLGAHNGTICNSLPCCYGIKCRISPIGTTLSSGISENHRYGGNGNNRNLIITRQCYGTNSRRHCNDAALGNYHHQHQHQQQIHDKTESESSSSADSPESSSHTNNTNDISAESSSTAPNTPPRLLNVDHNDKKSYYYSLFGNHHHHQEEEDPHVITDDAAAALGDYYSHYNYTILPEYEASAPAEEKGDDAGSDNNNNTTSSTSIASSRSHRQHHHLVGKKQWRDYWEREMARNASGGQNQGTRNHRKHGNHNNNNTTTTTIQYPLTNPAHVVNPKWDPSLKLRNPAYRKSLRLYYIQQIHESVKITGTAAMISRSKWKRIKNTDAMYAKLDSRSKANRPRVRQRLTEVLNAAIDLNVFSPSIAIALIRICTKIRETKFASDFLANYRGVHPQGGHLRMHKDMLKYLMRVHMAARNTEEVICELKRYLNFTNWRERFTSQIWRDIFVYASKSRSEELQSLLETHFSAYKLDFGSDLETISEAARLFKNRNRHELVEELSDTMSFSPRDIFTLKSARSHIPVLSFIMHKYPDVALEFIREKCTGDSDSAYLAAHGVIVCANAAQWEEGLELFCQYYPEVRQLIMQESFETQRAAWERKLPSLDAQLLPSLYTIILHMQESDEKLRWYTSMEILYQCFERVLKPLIVEDFHQKTMQYPSPLVTFTWKKWNAVRLSTTPKDRINPDSLFSLSVLETEDRLESVTPHLQVLLKLMKMADDADGRAANVTSIGSSDPADSSSPLIPSPHISTSRTLQLHNAFKDVCLYSLHHIHRYHGIKAYDSVMRQFVMWVLGSEAGKGWHQQLQQQGGEKQMRHGSESMQQLAKQVVKEFEEKRQK